MTYEEVIEILEELGGCCSSDKEYKATRIAIEVVRKQISKEHHHTRIRKLAIDFRESVCPSCLGVIATTCEEYPKYCTWCGQAIDWSE